MWGDRQLFQVIVDAAMEQREKDITTLAADLDYELEEDLKPPDYLSTPPDVRREKWEACLWPMTMGLVAGSGQDGFPTAQLQGCRTSYFLHVPLLIFLSCCHYSRLRINKPPPTVVRTLMPGSSPYLLPCR